MQSIETTNAETTILNELSTNSTSPHVKYYDLSDGSVLCVANTASGIVKGVGSSVFLASLDVYHMMSRTR